MTIEEESSLISAWQESRDMRARTKLVQANIAFVHHVVRSKFSGYGAEYEDMVQEGTAGLLLAIDKFKPGQNNKLCTYASHWIRQMVAQFIQGQPILTIAKGREYRRIFSRQGYIRDQLEQGRSMAEIANAIDVPEGRLKAIWAALSIAPLSFDSFRANEESPGSQTLHDFVSDLSASNEAEISERDERKRLADRVKAAMNDLTPKDRSVLEGRFVDEKTQEQIGEEIGVCRQHVLSIEKQALSKLRKRLSSEDVTNRRSH